jgi:RHS repeat-associated protein
VAEFVHDDWGNVVRRTNAVGERETYEYDGRRNLTAIVAADGGRSTFSYDQRGLLVGLADQAGAVTTLGYDRFGNVTSVTDPLGNGTTVAYDPSGIEVTSITDCRGNVTRYAHDANRRLTEVVHPDGTRNARIHDCCAEVLYTDENGGRLGVDRDALLRVIRGVQSPGQVVDLVYDGNSRLTQVTDALGRSTALVYDKAGRVTRTIDPTGQSVGVSYDGQGHPVTLVDERGGRTDLAYDHGGRLTKVTYPTGRSVETDRDALGRVVAVRNGRGEQVRLAYGLSGFLSGKWHGSDQVALYEHDAVGNLTSVQDVTGTTSYEYDARRRPTAIRFPGGLEASCSYDEAGNLARTVYPGSLVISYEYDARNRVSAVRWGEEQGVRLDYDGVGNVVRSICSNGTQSVFVYDRANRLVQLQHASGGRAFASRAYVRDAVGNLSRESSPESPPRHLPPPVSATATYDAANQLVTLDGERCEHDADGNLAVVGADRWRALYDLENRLVRVTRAGSSTAYAYNGVGQRVRRGAGDGVARYHYDLRGRLLFVTDESGTLEWAYVYAGDELVAAVDGSGKSFFYHFDIRGSTLALTDSQGSVVARYDYGPWGDPLHRDGDLPNLFTYVGKHGVLDDGSGLYFMKHRCYEAILGRYLQRDPLGVADSFNLYAYVLNNPINGIDPLGLSTAWGNVAWFLNVWQASVWLVVTVPTLPLPIISITTFVRGVSGMYCTLGPRASEYEREDYGGTDLVLDLIDPTNLRSKIPEAIDQGIEWAKTKRRELGQEFDETFNLENVKAKYGQR